MVLVYCEPRKRNHREQARHSACNAPRAYILRKGVIVGSISQEGRLMKTYSLTIKHKSGTWQT
ncbi:hypothetical protein LCGC14_1754940, partial [marine sediment metagenome]